MIKKIGVGVDGSPSSAAAVLWTADLAHVIGAHVTVVHAASLVERYQARGEAEDQFEEELRAQVDRDWCAPLRRRGTLYEVIVRAGPPVQMLLDVAGLDCDLLVVGRRGSGSSDPGRLGSTSQQLVAEAEVPVVVVAAPRHPG